MNRLSFLTRIGCIALAAGIASAAPPDRQPYDVNVAVVGQPGPLDAGIPEFDSSGTAYLRSGGDLHIVSPGGAVRTLALGPVAMEAVDRDILRGKSRWDGKWDETPMVDTAVVVDGADRLYTIITPRNSNLRQAILLWSADHARSWHAILLASRGATLEKPDAFNEHGPPTVISYENYGGFTGPRLWLEPMTIINGAVAPDGHAQIVTAHSLVGANHSGGGNSTFTTRDKIFVVYDSTGPHGAGTASYGRQYDRASHRFEGGEIPLGRSATLKGPDPHDMPAITADRDGILYVVIGAHHAMLQMTTSKRPDTMLAGWARPEPIGQSKKGGLYGSYSYASLNMSPRGTINIITRSEGVRGRYLLVQLQKKRGNDWTIWPNGTRERPIASPHRSDYVAWRQQVSMDRDGRLYLNFRYYPNELTDIEAETFGVLGKRTLNCNASRRCWYFDAPTMMPRTIVSDDDGDTWHSSDRR